MDYATHLAALLARCDGLTGPPLLEAVVDFLHVTIPHYHWVGFYLIDDPENLVLGPYRGKPTEHTRIPVAEGICGAAVREDATLVIDDVQADPRYLACSLETRSEIVVPLRRDGQVIGELDLDSDLPAAFTPADRDFLETIAAFVQARL